MLGQAQRFDLIKRIERALDARLRREIRELYLAARDAASLVGELRSGAGEWLFPPGLSGSG